MILEGHIPEDTDYDDWISDSKTWLQLADKCAYHQMYSLATDFYGLGITRDPDAYKKPMLWYRFAKSCKRCGRVADAQLAIKVTSSFF
jgi:RNA polymerase subunit RPABC4/transcription elongation factor Spt4